MLEHLLYIESFALSLANTKVKHHDSGIAKH
jgi:hypothetical protein